MSVTKNGFE